MNTNKPSILVVIATYNRPKSFMAALKSIDQQDYDDFSILISDNSTNTETEMLMEDIKLNHDYIYIHREPQPNGIVHFNKILEEMPSGYDYFMIFHDDDTLRDGAITSISALAVENPSCVAICSNGYKVKENGKVIGKFVKPDGNRVISQKRELAEKYLKEAGLPFPAILYKMETSKLPFDANKGGKYCDTAHTIDLLNVGYIYWASELFILNYTISNNQDSNILIPCQRRKLLRYLSKEGDISYKNPIIRKFRINDVFTYYRSNSKTFGFRHLLFLFSERQFKLLIKYVIAKVHK